jgi:hypothetical protein
MMQRGVGVAGNGVGLLNGQTTKRGPGTLGDTVLYPKTLLCKQPQPCTPSTEVMEFCFVVWPFNKPTPLPTNLTPLCILNLVFHTNAPILT